MFFAVPKTHWNTLLAIVALLMLAGCGGNGQASQAAIVGKWQLTTLEYLGASLPISPQDCDLQLQFYKENAINITTRFNSDSMGGDGTYKFADEQNVQIEMPQGSQGLEALKTSIKALFGVRVVQVVGPGTPTPTPPPPDPAFDTNYSSGIYEVHSSGDQLTIKGKDGITLTFKKID